MRVFIHLLLMANVKDGRFMGIVIKRGQTAISAANIATSLNMSAKEVRTALNHLKDTNEISAKRFNKFSLITINNYELYQNSYGEPKKQSKGRRKKETAQDFSEENQKDYKPKEWELEIPKEMWGRFSTEEDYWSHAEESEDA